MSRADRNLILAVLAGVFAGLFLCGTLLVGLGAVPALALASCATPFGMSLAWHVGRWGLGLSGHAAD